MEHYTKRLILRDWADSDIESFIAINQNHMVMEYYPNILSRNETITMINRIQNKFKINGFGLYAVELKENSQFIGYIGLNVPEFSSHFTPCVEIGWRLCPKYWGHGLAVEGANKCFEIAFRQFNLNEIVSFTAKLNHRSERVMQKLGMSHNIQDDFFHPKLAENHPLKPHVLYRMSRQRWQENHIR